MALQDGRLSAIKTLTGFDFAFQPSLDVEPRHARSPDCSSSIAPQAVTGLIGPPGTGKTHLSLALGVGAR